MLAQPHWPTLAVQLTVPTLADGCGCDSHGVQGEGGRVEEPGFNLSYVERERDTPYPTNPWAHLENEATRGDVVEGDRDDAVAVVRGGGVGGRLPDDGLAVGESECRVREASSAELLRSCKAGGRRDEMKGVRDGTGSKEATYEGGYCSQRRGQH
jgi:hypothetical protein